MLHKLLPFPTVGNKHEMAEINNDFLERTLQTNKEVIAENKTVTTDCQVKSRKSKFPQVVG